MTLRELNGLRLKLPDPILYKGDVLDFEFKDPQGELLCIVQCAIIEVTRPDGTETKVWMTSNGVILTEEML